jgi:DNA replication initiation complex subunit (GINS family)
MITYADLQRIYRAEKGNSGLEKVDDGFYADSQELLSKLGDEHIDYVKKLAAEIFERRRNKMVVHALRSPEKEIVNMTPLEKEFYSEVVFALQRYRDEAFSGSKVPTGWGEVRGNKVGADKLRIRFLSALPSIIGTDMVHYGPFKEGDVVDIPAANARILIEQDVAEEI